MSVNWDKVDEAALALMHLTTFVERGGVARSWKGFDWDILDRMFERGWISDPQTKARSVVVFDEAVRQSKELFEQRFGSIDEGTRTEARAVAPSHGQPAARCECGCGTAVFDRSFVPGHDQKLRIQLERRVGGVLALRDLIERLEEHAKGGSTADALSSQVRAVVEGSEDAG
jgi:hypothetical protein